MKSKIEDIYSEITGRKVGKVVYRPDGRKDVIAQPETVRLGVDFIEDRVGSLNEFRMSLYELHRGQFGWSHEKAIAILFPEGKVKK